MDRPYLRPVYDEPEFIVHTVWRLYGGWWDGNPASLKPASERALAAELAALAGGAQALADRALALLAEASPGAGTGGGARPGRGSAAARRAPGRAGLAGRAGGSGIARVRHEVFTARADAATSTMATGVFRWAARESLGEA